MVVIIKRECVSEFVIYVAEMLGKYFCENCGKDYEENEDCINHELDNLDIEWLFDSSDEINRTFEVVEENEDEYIISVFDEDVAINKEWCV